MKRYTVALTENARADILAFYDCILHEYKQPLTARRNRTGLYNEIRKLSAYAASIAVSRSDFIQSLYGPDARRINYKKLAIIFVIESDVVYIQRIIPASLIH